MPKNFVELVSAEQRERMQFLMIQVYREIGDDDVFVSLISPETAATAHGAGLDEALTKLAEGVKLMMDDGWVPPIETVPRSLMIPRGGPTPGVPPRTRIRRRTPVKKGRR